jgi:hypothetical protein
MLPATYFCYLRKSRLKCPSGRFAEPQILLLNKVPFFTIFNPGLTICGIYEMRMQRRNGGARKVTKPEDLKKK